MKSKRAIPAVTSLPQSPQAEGDHRVRRYALTMTIRIICFGLMVFIQPYGWYTWIFAIAAAVLPYIAVVFANAGSDSTETTAESPTLEVEAPRPYVAPLDEAGPAVFRIDESRRDES
ncbi:DUF3099 domain-containing protein [Microbacterium saperdae]|uniref:DUF3099 family protein n=1 Tax=Microbacterium saperdae TaxID=69368 RepID=A0A543BM63_9MICO|nr:DUF3099 domain-containing protein [Microbacterium saperdae]TQL85912.1 DUF3099 family protein [Microbacterium saperdae]GGM52107.1 hypothetical protein GCM10010489_24520 [Microbacterium saperdae]